MKATLYTSEKKKIGIIETSAIKLGDTVKGRIVEDIEVVGKLELKIILK